jgi:hypothetical protein
MASLATFRPATAAIDIGGAASTARLLSEAVAA